MAASWWRDRSRLGARGAFYIALAPSGLAAYSIFLWLRSGNPLLFLHDQAKWGRPYGGVAGSLLGQSQPRPETSARSSIRSCTALSGVERLLIVLSGTNYLLNLLCLMFAVALLAAAATRLPLGLTLYAAALTLTSAFFGTKEDPLLSLPRYLLVAFPLFVVLGTLLEDRRLQAAWVGAARYSRSRSWRCS